MHALLENLLENGAKYPTSNAPTGSSAGASSPPGAVPA